MPWQDVVSAVALEAHPDTGLLLHRLVVVTIPRQEGKTTLTRALEVWGALRGPRRRVMVTAQSRQDARSIHWEELAEVLAASRLAPLVTHVDKGAGREHIRFRNGSRVAIFSPNETGGHGLPNVLAIVDEAWSLTEAVIQAVQPAQQAQRDPQLWVVSTAGTDESVMLRRYVEMGRAGGAPMVYFDWSAPDDADPDDPAVWRAAMPALGITITEEAVAHARATMKDGDFRRAYLNQWTAREERKIPAEWWAACLDHGSTLAGPLCLAADIAADRSAGAIAVAGPRRDGRLHVEVIDRKNGTDWIAPRLRVLRARHAARHVAVLPSGPSATLVEELRRDGAPIAGPTGGEWAAACAALFDAVRDGTLRHRGQPALDLALAGAGTRVVGDGWAWSARASTGDLSPLTAVNLAYWAATAAPAGGLLL